MIIRYRDKTTDPSKEEWKYRLSNDPASAAEIHQKEQNNLQEMKNKFVNYLDKNLSEWETYASMWICQVLEIFKYTDKDAEQYGEIPMLDEYELILTYVFKKIISGAIN